VPSSRLLVAWKRVISRNGPSVVNVSEPPLWDRGSSASRWSIELRSGDAFSITVSLELALRGPYDDTVHPTTLVAPLRTYSDVAPSVHAALIACASHRETTAPQIEVWPLVVQVLQRFIGTYGDLQPVAVRDTRGARERIDNKLTR
jgi:hypothetical protein